MSRATRTATILLMPLYIIGLISLLLIAATPANASADDSQCDSYRSNPKIDTENEVYTQNGVEMWFTGDTLYIHNTNTVPARVIFCLKGGSKFWNGDFNTGIADTNWLPADFTQQWIGEQTVSNFVVYSVELQDSSPTPEPSQSEEPSATPEPSQSEKPSATPAPTATPEQSIGTPATATPEPSIGIPDTALSDPATKSDVTLAFILITLSALAGILHSLKHRIED